MKDRETAACNQSLVFCSLDIAFKDGKVGDYLFLGNMVYTVCSDGSTV